MGLALSLNYANDLYLSADFGNMMTLYNRLFLSQWLLFALFICGRVGPIHAQSFNLSQLSGEISINPTSIAFGPDKRLYVLEENGVLKIYTLSRPGANMYQVTATETVSLVNTIKNHNDNGQVFNSFEVRQATGMVITGTAVNPVVYVTSSDYRKGGGLYVGTDLNLDTNSGVISRLEKTGSTWSKVDLIRGLPRSEENHSTNGLFLDEEANMLFVAQGGNSNGGAPAQAFAYLCEYALAGAILTVDLNILDTMPILVDTNSGANFIYDLPTVDDPTRANANGISDPMDMDYNGVDLHDPFGGNDGLNQARLMSDGPVQIYATGIRNMYDLTRTELGYLYGWDNGPNPGWGGYPSTEGAGTATNKYPSGEPGSGTMNDIDCLHRIDSMGYYGGHPNPVRGNVDSAGLYTYGASGVFRSQYLSGNPANSLPYDWPPLPNDWDHPIEGDFQISGTQNSYIASLFKKSMNGICEYTAAHFDSAMTGDLLTTALNTNTNSGVYRIDLNTSGTVDGPGSVTILASGLLGGALDVCTLGNEPPFPGTIWIIAYGSGGRIYVLEPSDFFVCTGADSYLIDEDSDGYTNADEYDNDTNPCNGADRPSDFDETLISGFKVSDLNDPDDDDDGINDTIDFFALDAANGLNTTLPIEYPLLNAIPGSGFYGLGFTGLMSNSLDDYLDLWKTEDNSSTFIIAGGAAGLLTYIDLDDGDAINTFDNQHNGFQFGFAVDSSDRPFIAEAQIVGPVFPDTIQDFQSIGMYLGTGDQDNYVKIVVNANNGTPGIAVVKENNGSSTTTQYSVSGIGTQSSVRLALIVNPANGYMRAQYAVGSNDLQDLGDGFYLTGAFLDSLMGPQAIAMGVISTARGSTNRFEATWAHLSIRHDPETKGNWYTLQDGTDCEITGTGSCCQARHEASYVQSGDKFYLIGGREHSSNVNIYNPTTDIWTTGANPPSNSLHHFQAVDYYGLILAVGAFSGSFPVESPVTVMRVYNPLTNTWHVGPTIPVGRRRGAAGAVVRNDTLYVLGGATNGHIDGHVNWLDRYNFRTDTWSTLPNAPNQRDHFHAALKDNKIYAAAGRRTSIGNLFENTEPTIDRFNISNSTWDTIAAQIPTQRAGNTAAILGNELIVIGGEREMGYSKNATEALNLDSLTWRTLDVMNVGRNGTQAIVNNSGLYVASGAAKRGGDSLILSTEAFFMFGQTDPILTPTDASDLTADNQDFGEVPIEESVSMDLYIHNTNGNQAILLQSMSMFNGTIFTLDTMLTFPRFLKPGDSLRIPIEFLPSMIQSYSDTLYFQHTGSNAPVKKVVLTGEGIYNWLGNVRAYVDSSATGNGLGNSWQNAFTSVTEALVVAAEFSQITEVWIAKGIYRPANSRSASFVLRDSLTLYGGFHGTEILLGQRDVEDYPVILSGDVGVLNDSTDNTYHVVIMTSTSKAATLDGVIIEDGLANGALEFDRRAAGVLNFGKLNLVNTTIRHCTSLNAGSALVNSGVAASMILENVLFHNNSDPHLVNESNAVLNWKGILNLLQEE